MLGRRTTGGASAERRAEGAAEAGMPFFDLYGKMPSDLHAWEESDVIHQRIVYSINTFGPVGVDGFRPAAKLNRQPGREVSHVYSVHDRRNMARCFRLWNALLWDRPEQRLFLPAQHRRRRYGHFWRMYRRQRDYRLPSAFWNIDDRQGMPCGWLDNFWLLQPGPFLRQYMANVGFTLAFRRWQQADRNPGVDLPKMQEHREFSCHLGISFRDGRKSVAECGTSHQSLSRPCRALSTPAPRAGLSGGGPRLIALEFPVWAVCAADRLCTFSQGTTVTHSPHICSKSLSPAASASSQN